MPGNFSLFTSLLFSRDVRVQTVCVDHMHWQPCNVLQCMQRRSQDTINARAQHGHCMGTLSTSVQTSVQSEEAFSKAREELVYGNS